MACIQSAKSMIAAFIGAIVARVLAFFEFIVTPLFMPLVEKGLLPDFIIRWAVRVLLQVRLPRKSVTTHAHDLLAFVEDLRSRPTICVQADAANEQHYDEVPPEFYEQCLGAYRKYSAGLWLPNAAQRKIIKPSHGAGGGSGASHAAAPGTADDPLSLSEAASLELVIERAQIKDGHDVLELGCGWGSFTLYAAAKFPRCTITCVSNSGSQRRYIEAEAAKRGLTNIRARTANINDFDAGTNTADRVVSIEMFEHMKNYELLFRRISDWLRPDGKMFVHIFSIIGSPYHFLPEDGWMAQNFFTGGTMPSDDLFLYFQKDLSIANHWRIDGTHYSRTCNEWLKRMDANKDKVLPIISRTYADAKDDPTRRFVMWRLFYLACAEMFGYNNGQTWIVSHYLFENKHSH